MDARIDPESCRRAGVRSFPITLADGQAWGFALPSTRIKPEVVADVDELGRPLEVVRVATEVGYPLEIRRLIDALRSACESGESSSQYQALIRLALGLLRRAHELDAEVAACLLEVEAEDLPGFVNAVLSVVTGDCLQAPGSSS